jgi:hypothetical protein
MFYVLLILPHLLAIAGLLAYALHSAPVDAGEDGYAGPNGGSQPPLDPSPPPPVDYPLVSDAASPRRRLRVGERLSDQHARPPRREHPIHEPTRLGASDVR